MALRSRLAQLALGVWLVIGIGSGARADDAALRARLDALGTLADTEADLGRAARAALDRAEADRGRGDEAAAVRAEHIAEASMALIERRRARADAEARLASARAARDAMRARLETARSAAASDASERARLAPEGTAP